MNFGRSEKKDNKIEKLPILKPGKRIKRKQFIINIGDEGAILIYLSGGKLVNRLFSTISNEEDKEKFAALLRSDPLAPISILVDVSDQTYAKHSMPGVGSLSLNKLVQKKLNRDFPSVELKGSISLGKSNNINEWNLIFVSCPTTSPLKEWLEFIELQNNPIIGIFMLPIEISSLLVELNKVYFPTVKNSLFNRTDKKSPKWQLIVTHNKVGGFRQIAFYDNKIVFTRLIPLQPNESAHYIAGNIEQELLNTVEYLKRLSFKENDGFDLFIITSQEIKNSLQKIKFTSKNLFILTPYELSYKIGLNDFISDEDKYADIITIVNFANNKPILPLYTQSIRKNASFSRITGIIQTISLCIIACVVIFLIKSAVNIYLNKKIIDEKNMLRSLVENKLSDTKLKSGNISELNKMNNIVKLYKILTKNNNSPLTFIQTLISNKNISLDIRSINWQLKDEQNNSLSIVFSIDGDFYNNKLGYQELFDEFDNFIKKLEESYKGYRVEYSRNTEKINFDDSNKKIPIKIKITTEQAKAKDNLGDINREN
jgi:hypothetical protein